MRWANFIHIYQPPTQTADIVRKVTEESYRKVAEELTHSPRGKMTVNISGALTELWMKYGYDDVIAKYRSLLEEGKIEMTGSMMYHPFSPKLPKEEIVRQIELNTAINSKAFGPAYKPRGFFVPEMVYTKKVAEIVKECGYQWMIIDESSFPQDKGKPQYDSLYRIKSLGDFYCFFRDRTSSFKILSAQIGSGEAFVRDFVAGKPATYATITGMDGETFGHHRYGLEKLLGDVFASPEVEALVISDFFSLLTKTQDIEPVDGTWALFSLDEVRTTPFSRWYDPENKIHEYQWELTDLAITVVHRKPDPTARALLDKAVHSDQYWWASARPWWSIEMIERGAHELETVVKESIGATKKEKERAAELYKTILFTSFDWQRTGVVDKLVKRHIDEEAHYRIKENLRGMPREELENMLKHLAEQMDQAVTAGEYTRAAEFQKRIKELEEQKDFLLEST